MTDYYDWDKTRTYDADITMVVGARGIGKTFGLRLCFLRDYLKRGICFCEIARYRDERRGMAGGYFGRIQDMPEFSKYVFRTSSESAWIAAKPKDGEKPAWKLCGYFVSLTQAQALKKRTFAHVGNICFDEAIADRRDRYHGYLPDEFEILANVVDTVTRERADVRHKKPHVYLLGNAVDILNPYFAAYHVGVPERGKHWYGAKTFLLDYVPGGEYSVEKAAGTVAGRMLAGRVGGTENVDNTFSDAAPPAFIKRKPRTARIEYGIVWRGDKYGVWSDPATSYLWVTSGYPADTSPVFAITAADFTVDMMTAKKADKVLKGFADLFGAGIVRFDRAELYPRICDLLRMYGLRAV